MTTVHITHDSITPNVQTNHDRAERIVHSLSQYLTVRFLAVNDHIANPEQAMDEAGEHLVETIEVALNEVVLDAIEP